MTTSSAAPFVTVDIGNSRIKFGVFTPPWSDPLPQPSRALSVDPGWTEIDIEHAVAGSPANYAWLIASVNRPAASRLTQWLERAGVNQVRILAGCDMPIEVAVDRPQGVGLDRLANAVAANRIRTSGVPAIVIDFGSAITVDKVDSAGRFVGGAILPGVDMSARALHEFTDLLPLVEIDMAPPVLGTSTSGAIASGLYWGAVGAVRELVARLTIDAARAEVFITGGAAAPLVQSLRESSDHTTLFVPHLTLSGIAAAAGSRPEVRA